MYRRPTVPFYVETHVKSIFISPLFGSDDSNHQTFCIIIIYLQGMLYTVFNTLQFYSTIV